MPQEKKHTAGQAEITSRTDDAFPFRKVIRCDHICIAIAEGDTVQNAEANAARLVDCWNNYDKIANYWDGALQGLKDMRTAYRTVLTSLQECEVILRMLSQGHQVDPDRIRNVGQEALKAINFDPTSSNKKTEPDFEYEMFLKSELGDVIRLDGWYPISADCIHNPEKIEEYIKNGVLRKLVL